MSHLHWMKFYIGDELAATSHMTPAEFGSYVYLKMHYWQFGSLPNIDARLARIAHVSPEQWAEIRPSIDILFTPDWQNPRMDEMRLEAEEKHQSRVEAGKKGGRPRKDQKQSYKLSFSGEKAMPKQPEPEPEPDPYSDLAPESQSEPAPADWALDKGSKDTFTRAFPKPRTLEDGKLFLKSRGCPSDEMEKCLKLLMGEHLTPFDIEPWDIGERARA
jgi:uncharacterized protein YdaU (DUF1376 family)